MDFYEVCERAAKYANGKDTDDRLALAEKYLRRCDWGDSTFGIEYISMADREMAYLNTGETYQLTIVSENNRLQVGSWGGWYESVEEEHCKTENVVRCGYCGEFTENNEKSWNVITCNSCGHNVNGSW